MRQLVNPFPGIAAVLAGVWFIVSLWPEAGLAASEGDRVAWPHSQGTVRVRGPGGDGFGFIVGEKSGRLYLLTANHVVSGPDAKVQIYFAHERIEPVAADPGACRSAARLRPAVRNRARSRHQRQARVGTTAPPTPFAAT
jgi:hypothetical protein